MPDIKIKRCADKENLKKLMRYIKATFANKSEVNEEFYTKEQIDTMLESGSGGGGTGGDYYTKSEIDTKLTSKANKTTTLSGYGITDAYTKPQVDKKVSDLVNSAPETLATLNELAKALGDDPNFATTVATQIGKKANSSDVYNKSETDTLLSDLAKKSDLAKVATSGNYNDLINAPDIHVNNDGSLYVKRDTDGNFFLFTHTGWSTSPVNAWGGMYFKTSDKRNVFGFAARQSSFPIEKFTVGNNGYLRGYDTQGNRTVTLTINGGTAGQPNTQNITVDGTFVNAGNQKPYSANNYTIGTSDMPYKAMYAGTFNTASPSGDSGLIASKSNTGHSLLFGIGDTGVNRGIYDNKNSRWSVFLDDTDYIMTQCPTPPKGDSSNKLATTEWVQTELADKADTSALDAKVDVSALDSYATKDDLSASVPVGTVFHGMYSSIPTGFLALNGQTISKTTYSALYNVLKAVADANGTSLDDSGTTFTLPTISYDNLTAIIKY